MSCDRVSVKETLAGKESHGATAVTPALKQKVIDAFVAVEEALTEAFPDSKKLAKVLYFVDIAAAFVSAYLR